jgi:hypothetical protein
MIRRDVFEPTAAVAWFSKHRAAIIQFITTRDFLQRFTGNNLASRQCEREFNNRISASVLRYYKPSNDTLRTSTEYFCRYRCVFYLLVVREQFVHYLLYSLIFCSQYCSIISHAVLYKKKKKKYWYRTQHVMLNCIKLCTVCLCSYRLTNDTVRFGSVMISLFYSRR